MWCELSIRSSVCPTCLSACCVFLLAFLLFPASVSPLPLSYWRDASLFVFLSSVFLFVLLYPNLFSTPGSKRMSHCAITALPIHASAFLHLSRSACVLPAHWVLPREAENSLLILYDPKSFFFLRDLASLIDVFLHIFQLGLKVCGAVCGVACHRYHRNNRQAICATFARARKLTEKSRRFAV